jgi:ubiquinone biosynthesis protein
VVRSWIEQNLGPLGKIQDAGRAASTLARFATNLPVALVRAESLVMKLEGLAEEGFELSERAIERIGAAEARKARVGHVALWVIALVAVLMLLR